MGKTKRGSDQWSPRTFKSRELVIILAAWVTSALSMNGTATAIHTRIFALYSEDPGAITVSSKLAVGLFMFLGALVLLDRIMR
jgi:hypothetical protein